MTSLLACTHEKKEARLINTLSPNIHIQILQTDLYIYISLKNELREFDKRSKHFLLGDDLVNSHNLIP